MYIYIYIYIYTYISIYIYIHTHVHMHACRLYTARNTHEAVYESVALFMSHSSIQL